MCLGTSGRWFDKAAKQGYVAAQYALGKLYLSDDASVHDPELGIQWLEYAAYNGNHDASYRLGKEYLKGESVRRDTRKAMDHIYTSAQAGNLHAQYLLGKLLLQGKAVERDKEAGILPQSGTGLTHIDRKRRQELREKRLVHGHKEDDHEEQQYGSWNMTMH